MNNNSNHIAQLCYSVIGDKPFLWSKAKFDPPQLCTPWTDYYQTWYGWLRRRPLLKCQF